jgi:hypothetical protein
MISETPAGTPESPPATENLSLEVKITQIGRQLSSSLTAVLDAVPGAPHGPQKLSEALGVDKVLASRVLKAARHRDPVAVAHLVPGPEPMRRLLRAAGRGPTPKSLIDAAKTAVDEFEHLIRQEAGDRSALDAIISAWLPEAREQFELRRKQAAFRAMSQLKGAQAEVNLATVLLHPSDDGTSIDIIWIMGLLGLQRLRPDVGIKFTSRRMAEVGAGGPRRPVTLEGEAIDGLDGVKLDRFCDAPPAELEVHRVGDVNHYTLANIGFGPRSRVDLVMAEVNLAEMPRFVKAGSGRKGNVFAEIATPSKSLLFDVFVHEQIYPGSSPALLLYDTALEGVASVNDRTRDIDRLDMMESVQSLGQGVVRHRVAEIPQYVSMVRHVFEKMGWNDQTFRGYRCRIDYPLYGSQVVMAFDPPAVDSA